MKLYFIILFELLSATLCHSYLRTPFRRSSSRARSSARPAGDDVGRPLLLTPLIKDGKVDEARVLSRVSGLSPDVNSYAAFLTVNETHNSNLFFWFFPKTGDDWRSVPVVLWLQGGPGCSSVFGLFTENGPFAVAKAGLRRRKYAWTNRYNVLYVDQPVGSGFSFTESDDGYVSSQSQVGAHLYETLTQFFQLFPELRRNELYISGESYAGKYVPAIAHTIHENVSKGNSTINLKGLFIASGFTDPISFAGYSDLCHQIGIIDSATRDRMRVLEEEVRIYIRSGLWLNATRRFDEILGELGEATQFEGFYDYTRECAGVREEPYVDYVQSDKVRKAIHVGDREYDECSEKVYEHLQADIMKSVKPWVEELLNHYRIAYYGGQLDIITAYSLVVNFLRELKWKGAEEYGTAERKRWYVGHRLAGYVKTAGNLSDVMVRNAGHMVPGYQNRFTLDLLKKFVDQKL